MSRFTLSAIALTCLLLPITTFAAGTGTCTYKDKKLTLVDGVVYQRPDHFEPNKKETTVALASLKLDPGKIAAAKDPEDAVREQVWKADDGGQVRITLGEGGVTAIYAYLPPGANISQSGTAFGDLKLSRNDAKGVAGHYTLKGKASDDLSCDFGFDLAYAKPGTAATSSAAPAAAAAQGGKPIPAGGGEAGKVLQANLAAMQKGDVDAMLATVSKQQADQMQAQRKDAQFPAMLEMMKAFAPKSLTVTGGQDFGDHAELTLEGVEQGGGKSTGTAQMVKEGGKWKVQKTSMQSKGG
ncbi:DUF4878 domain-containing protein [Rudaea cellulosilytica]|uniref:DUF4878 domain-containing protein n=1 Tax=Rudaea cellulosilytica TaxID=540746 RepID=UPI00037391D0|nr:DUF4878 domain-containing protein [Rudaea cellulosilytica]